MNRLLLLLILFNSFISNSFASSPNKRKIIAEPNGQKIKAKTSRTTSPRTTADASFSAESTPSSALSVDKQDLEYIDGDDNDTILFDIDINDKMPEIPNSSYATSSVSTNEAKAAPLTINDPFESFGNIFDGTVPEESLAWDLEKEATLYLPDILFKQYRALIIDKSLSKNLPGAVKKYFKGKYVFDRDWPVSGIEISSTMAKLSQDYQAFALKIILKPAHVGSLRRLLESNLVDLSKPIFNTETGVYHSFLILAILERNIESEKFDLILQNSPNGAVNLPSSDGIVPLVYAIRLERLDLIQKLVIAGADINYTQGTLLTPFMEALSLQQSPAIDYFLTLNTYNPNQIVDNEVTALSLAAIHLPSEYFKAIHTKLIGEKSNPILPRIFSNSLKKIYLVNTAAFTFLIKSTFTPNQTLQSILLGVINLAYEATITDNLKLMQLMHLSNVPVKIILKQSYLLHIAAKHGSKRIVRYLIESKFFDINCASLIESRTAIQLAYENKHQEIVVELIKMGAVVGLDQILQEVIELNEIEIIKNIVTYCDPSNVFNLANGYNLLTWSVRMDKPDILVLLLEWKGITVAQNDLNGDNLYTVPVPEKASNQLISIIESSKM